MKLDVEGYEAKLLLIYDRFESSLHLFLQQSTLSLSSDLVVSKPLISFNAEVRTLPASLHSNLAQAIILLVNKKTGGLSNRKKQHSKAMPLATKRARAARSRQEKKAAKARCS
ncbi:hypothetical protein HPP92_027089 [Vanilla planifolia]|uniref:Uncharacterized protein n=1 Tax=Vanilla planifolia TaxID=51239 RepID=A0A835PCL0_VANPL|nr:hypothetical protein HPP92_027089 [Vanilla planifolia]